MMNYKALTVVILGLGALNSEAAAEPVSIEAVLAPVETMRMPFKDGSDHFVLIQRRQGVSEGTGALAGATIDEFGWHDITPGVGGDPVGYIEVTVASGDIAYLKWQARAVFREGQMGPPIVHGIWELVSGTGTFAGARGLGALQIGPGNGPGQPERHYRLQGDISTMP